MCNARAQMVLCRDSSFIRSEDTYQSGRLLFARFCTVLSSLFRSKDFWSTRRAKYVVYLQKRKHLSNPFPAREYFFGAIPDPDWLECHLADELYL